MAHTGFTLDRWPFGEMTYVSSNKSVSVLSEKAMRHLHPFAPNISGCQKWHSGECWLKAWMWRRAANAETRWWYFKRPQRRVLGRVCGHRLQNVTQHDKTFFSAVFFFANSRGLRLRFAWHWQYSRIMSPLACRFFVANTTIFVAASLMLGTSAAMCQGRCCVDESQCHSCTDMTQCPKSWFGKDFGSVWKHGRNKNHVFLV